MKKFWIVILLCVQASWAYAADNVQTTLRGVYPFGPSQAAASDPARNIFFIGSGAAVLVMDFKQPASPAVLSESIRAINPVSDIDYDSARGLLFVSSGALQVWNVSDPAHPTKLSEMQPASGVSSSFAASSSAFEGNLVYSVAGENLHVIDVSNASAPVLKGSAHIPPDLTQGIALSLNAVTVKDANAYITGTQRDLRVVHYDAPTNTFTYIGDTGYNADKTGRGPVVYGDDLFFYSSRGGLARVHLPVPQGFIDSTPAFPQYGVLYTVQGHYGYVSRRIDTAYAVDIVDMNDPINLPVLSSYNLPTNITYNFPVAFAATDTQAVVPTQYSDTRILDVSNKTQPVEVGTYVLDGVATRVVADNGKAYLVEPYGGVQIVDLSDVTLPVRAATIANVDSTQDVAVQGNNLFVLDGQSLRVFDKSNLDASLAEYALTPPAATPTSLAYRVAVSGNLLMAGIGTDIELIDVSIPSQPKSVGRYSASGYVRGIQIVNTTAVIAEGDEVLMLDVSNPAAPVALGSYPVAIIYDARMVGNYVYAIIGYNGGLEGLEVLDVSNPARIQQVGFAPIIGSLKALAIDGNTAYVASSYSGIKLVNISDPTNPYVFGTYNDFNARQIAGYGPYFLVAGNYVAMKVVENLGVPVNQPPIANAGPDQSVAARLQVLLNGSGSSDPDGSIVKYHWQQTSGSKVKLEYADSVVARFIAPKVRRGSTETLTFELTVTDNLGASATDSVAVTVHY